MALQAVSQDRATHEAAGRSTPTRYLDTANELLFGETKGGVRWCTSHVMSANPYGAPPSLLSVNPNASPKNKNTYSKLSFSAVFSSRRSRSGHIPTCRRPCDTKATRGRMLCWPTRSFVPARCPLRPNRLRPARLNRFTFLQRPNANK